MTKASFYVGKQEVSEQDQCTWKGASWWTEIQTVKVFETETKAGHNGRL